MPVALRPPPGTPGKAWPAIVVGLFVAFGGMPRLPAAQTVTDLGGRCLVWI